MCTRYWVMYSVQYTRVAKGVLKVLWYNWYWSLVVILCTILGSHMVDIPLINWSQRFGYVFLTCFVIILCTR